MSWVSGGSPAPAHRLNCRAIAARLPARPSCDTPLWLPCLQTVQVVTTALAVVVTVNRSLLTGTSTKVLR
jgi:hypothetical protein